MLSRRSLRNVALAYRAWRVRSRLPPASRALRAHAVTDLGTVVPYLIGERPLPSPPAAFRPYSRDHAVVCASWLIDMWQDTPGACDWLADQPPPRERRRR